MLGPKLTRQCYKARPEGRDALWLASVEKVIILPAGPILTRRKVPLFILFTWAFLSTVNYCIVNCCFSFIQDTFVLLRYTCWPNVSYSQEDGPNTFADIHEAFDLSRTVRRKGISINGYVMEHRKSRPSRTFSSPMCSFRRENWMLFGYDRWDIWVLQRRKHFFLGPDLQH